MYRQVLSSASEQLKTKHKKLGKCVDRARPFYVANMDARQVSISEINAVIGRTMSTNDPAPLIYHFSICLLQKVP